MQTKTRSEIEDEIYFALSGDVSRDKIAKIITSFLNITKKEINNNKTVKILGLGSFKKENRKITFNGIRTWEGQTIGKRNCKYKNAN
jgi:nucleoid DNA-binding protein